METKPYPGDETEQALYVPRLFNLTRDLDLVNVVWLFLHDWDQQESLPAFSFIGLRDNEGVPRPADGVWQLAVALRQQ